MKKENIIKTIVVLSGVGLSYVKYNIDKFLNIDHLTPIIVVVVTLFISSIYILNKKVYGLRGFVFNPKIKSLLFTRTTILNSNNKDTTLVCKKHKKLKTPKVVTLTIWLFLAIGLGTLLGFNFKTFNSRALMIAMNKKTQWESEAYLNWLKSKIEFFELRHPLNSAYGGFDFNWFYCFLGIIMVMIIYALTEKTKFIEIIKSKIKPYLK